MNNPFWHLLLHVPADVSGIQVNASARFSADNPSDIFSGMFLCESLWQKIEGITENQKILPLI